MTIQERGELIDSIISALRFTAREQNKPFDAGDAWFSLVFKTGKELLEIARLCGV